MTETPEAKPAGRAGNPGKRPATYLKAHERDALLALAEGHPRDKAILTLAVFTGVRRNELRMLDKADVDWGRQMLAIRHGKGGKEREVPLNAKARAALKAYLATRDDDEAPLFLSRQRRRLDNATLWHILNRYTSQIGLPQRIRFHSTRHTFSMAVKEKSGKDYKLLQGLLGHASPETTMRYYDHFDADEARKVLEDL